MSVFVDVTFDVAKILPGTPVRGGWDVSNLASLPSTNEFMGSFRWMAIYNALNTWLDTLVVE